MQEYRDQDDMLLIVYLQWLTITSQHYFLPRSFRILNLDNNETLDQLFTRHVGQQGYMGQCQKSIRRGDTIIGAITLFEP
jgi:hypothetical protein